MTSKNPSQITFNIGEEEINLIFNNSSIKEMGKIMFYPDDELKAKNPNEYEREMVEARRKENDITKIFSEINQIVTDNYWFTTKIIIYSDIVGYYLESSRPRPKYSFKQVGELIGKMTQEELMDYTVKVWGTFLDQIGINLAAIKEVESESDQVKKK